jgi:gliding motility-associated-like protein
LTDKLITNNKKIQNFTRAWFFALFFLLLSFHSYCQCVTAVTISASGTSICSGNSVVLTAIPTGGATPYTYSWSTGENTQSITVDKGGTYKVSMTNNVMGCLPVTAIIDIIEAVTPDAPTAFNQIVCPNSSATLQANTPGGTYQWYDAPTGGNFLASGDTYVTPPITKPTTFYIQTTINGCTSARGKVFVDLTKQPNLTGMTVCAGNSATLSAKGGDSYEWYDSPSGGNLLSTTSGYTTPPLTATTVYYVIATTNGCRSIPTPVTAVVTPYPQAPVLQNITICSGSVANLNAPQIPGGVYSWYDVPSGGTPLISSPDYTTPSLTATTTYYVQVSTNGCESQRAAVTITVNPIPPVPVAQTDTICPGSSITLTATATPAGNYTWYDAPTGGKFLAAGISYQTPVLNNTTNYYVQTDNGGCSSTRALVKVVVKPPVPAPSVSGAIICYGSSTTLAPTGPGGSYQWYDAPSGGNLITTGNTYTTPALTANITYYVQTTLAGCTSPLSAVTVSVIPQVTRPSAQGVIVCSGSPATLTATGAGNYSWYDAQTGGNLLSTGQVYVTPALSATTTYYVQTNASGCTSLRTPATVTVNPIPSAPVSNGVTVCSGSSANLTASVASGTVQWYDASSGGNLLASGNAYTTPALNRSTTYYVQNTMGQCSSARTPVTVTVNTIYSPQFQYLTGSVCSSATNQIPVINNPAGGTFSASPAGLVFVNNQTGEINVSASALGKYIISFTSNNPCPVTTGSAFSIVTNPYTQFSYNASYCQDDSNPSPLFTTGATAGTFSATPSGLVFANSSTGEIDLKNSLAGTYTITNNIPAIGGCAGSSSSTTATIYQAVTVNAGPNQTVATGSLVQLSGTIAGVAGGKWSGGKGSFSDPTLLNPVYTPGPSENPVTLSLTSDNPPPGQCGPKTASVTITFGNAPAAPTVTGNAICMGSSATLSAIAPGGAYQWYDAANGGNILATGAVYNTPPLLANTTYYVQTTVGGITSSRTAVKVSVNPIPVAPVVQGTTICMGNSAKLTIADTTATYAWYDAAAGGNLLSVSSTYVTPALSSNQSYYVQTNSNGCVSNRTEVDVIVKPVPVITSSTADVICSGNAINYVITANIASATFLWSRAQVSGVSNPAIANQTNSTINETLINTGSTAVNVTYVITPIANGCPGSTFNYVVTVYPTPVVTSAAKTIICNGTTANYQIEFNTAAGFAWSRAAVAGITNAAVTGQAAGTIRENLFNSTNTSIDVTYAITSQTATCAGIPFNVVITVDPTINITSPGNAALCSGTTQNYVITSNVSGATFLWHRDAVNNISNPPVTNQTSSTITETLINTGSSPVNVTYLITPVFNGCNGSPFRYTVTVNPIPSAPVVNSNSPVCIGNTIQLSTSKINNATYFWTGPNGFTSSTQNPTIQNTTLADSGTYSLYVLMNGCSGRASTVQILVKQPPVAYAGPNQTVCITAPAVTLAGKVSGGTTTGIWTSSGTGTFLPSITALNGQYIPSAQDKTAGFVTLTLSSTSKDNCNISTSNTNIKFGPVPAVLAGSSMEVCAQSSSVKLNGKLLIAGSTTWSTSGSGTFNPSATQLITDYIPSKTDILRGSVILSLNVNNPGVCYLAKDSIILTFEPPPIVNAGGIRYVLKNNKITLHPSVNENDVKYLWTPDIDIDNNTIKNPEITGNTNMTYTLEVTDKLGCVSIDSTFINVSPELIIPNTFTPNGDGINDLWDIRGLTAYQQATIDVFDRYGQKLFHSIGYGVPWDGTYNGKQLPTGVYYYIIDTKVNSQVLSGSITIIR